jgi:multisubunit Na+/H+ antiporter MnhG subunit
VLLGLGAAAQLLCCVGVLAMRTTADRLHYASAGTTIGPILVIAALIAREQLAGHALQAIAAVAVTMIAGTIVTHALGRAIRAAMERESR